MTFLNKYKIGKLDRKQIKNEYNIIYNILGLKNSVNDKRHSTINISDKINNKEPFCNTSRTPIGIRNKYLIKKYNTDKDNNDNNNKNNLKNNNEDKGNYSNMPMVKRYSKIEELIKSFEEQ